MSPRPGDQPYTLAVSVRPEDGSTMLFFGHLTGGMRGTLRVAHYRQPDLAEELSGASAIILVRALFELDPVIWFARLAGVPLYYFVDDNFMLLREQPGVWSAFVEPYSARNVREHLRAFSGVLVSSRALLEYFEAHRLHGRVMLFPPVGWPSTLPRPSSNGRAASVGFFGGSHLHGVLEDYVLPAIRRVAAGQPLRFVVAGVSEPIATSPGLTVVHQPYDLSYSRGLRTLAAAGVDVLVHPSLPGHANNAYKNPHALISAHAIGAVPVVSARPPYDDLPESGIVLQCEDTIDSWYLALKRALQPAEHRAVSDRLASFCASHFDGGVNRQVIESLVGHPVSRSAAFVLARRIVAELCLGVDLVWRRARSGGSSVARILNRVSGIAPSNTCWIERVSGLDGWNLWAVCEGGSETLTARSFPQWRAAADRYMAGRPEVASYSVPPPTAVTFLSGRTADLIGLSPHMHQISCARSQLQEWMAAATRKGLVHHVVRPGADEGRSAISVGIDAAWLGGTTESGAQVAATEMVRGLAGRPEVDRVMLISESGDVPAGLQGIGKVSGAAWSSLLARDTPAVDIMHRPYQPGTGVDYRRYHRVARCVALSVLDFIAYDNPNYHESEWAWRQYQLVFDENVCLADCVFAISRSVGARLEQQFAHQLAGPVRPALLGTDHLQDLVGAGASVSAQLGPAVRALENGRFLLVLGNDFEHKNRDFAVKVFADMRDRGYDGRLVLAGFHLDLGSSFGHEMLGAGGYSAQVIRLGSVSSAEKAWLLQTAQAVLYPTSAEGFGLVPFEAAAVGTPTAFVKFGPLAETLPDVDGCAAWQVRTFADHVFRLLADPAGQVAQIRAAGAALTWSAYVDQILAGYQYMLSPGASWRARSRQLPTWQTRLQRAADALAYRARNKLRRLAGRTS